MNNEPLVGGIPVSPVDRELSRQHDVITDIHVRFEELERLLGPVLKEIIPVPDKNTPESPPDVHCPVSQDIANRTHELINIRAGLEAVTRRLGI